VAEPTLPLTGGCMCGAVRFEISEPLLSAHYCHCKRCQRRSGTGASISARPVPGSYRVVTGEELIRYWSPDDGGWLKSFCSVCGSQLYSQSPEDPERMGIRMGSFDEDPGVRPSSRQFTAYAAPWAPVPDDGLPRHPERAPASASSSE
jgi:hypothetical protein